MKIVRTRWWRIHVAGAQRRGHIVATSDDMRRKRRSAGASATRAPSGPRRLAAAVLGVAALLVSPRGAWASDCPGRTDVIATDRPDTTNSSLVVPFGSLQVENGINWAVHQGSQVLDASETRARLGVAHCSEVLVDVPNYFIALNGLASSQLSNFTVSIKRQLFPERRSFSLSASAGFGFPVGHSGDSDAFYTPYVQFPWSLAVADDWSVNGMLTVTWMVNRAEHTSIVEPTLVVEREVGSKGDLFVEYIGDFATRTPASHIADVGGAWHVTLRQQFDFHLGFGLTRSAPDRYVGVGYSLRLDGLFGASPQQQ
ncbi:MAG: transporter [Acidobacteria bacterium]|nr:MAG: transporter [Acidobacteriota bacterium]PYQ90391.1 MAG: transporter [Acidobacteriota bacterium]PYR10316.1 MAG: transporter [Acidobacteriota bacterium]